MKIKLIGLLFLAVLLSAHSPKPPDLAYILEGEASLCPTEALLALAYMHHRGSRFNGWAEPGERSLSVAVRWFDQPDPAPGAEFWFSADDLKLPEVQAIIKGKSVVTVFDCHVTTISLY